MLSLQMRTSLALLACMSVSQGFSSFRPCSVPSLVVRNAKNPDRARFERDMDEAMDNDWRVFRAKLVAAEKAGGAAWAHQPPVYSFNSYKQPSLHPEIDLSGVNSADFFAIEDHGKTDDNFRPYSTNHPANPTPSTNHPAYPMPQNHQINPLANHQPNWHSSNQPPAHRHGGNAAYTYQANPTGAYVPRDPYSANMNPNTAYNPYSANMNSNTVYNNNAAGPHQEPPSSPYISPYPTMPAWAAEQKTHFLERPNLLNCDDGKLGQQEYGYQNPNVAKANWPSSNQPQGSYTYVSSAATRPRPPSRKYFPSKNAEMPRPDIFQRNGWIGMEQPVDNTFHSTGNGPMNSQNGNGILEEDPFVSEAMRRQIRADLPSLSPKTKIDKHRWAHEIPGIEKGAVLVATERVNDVFQQTVVLITEHHEVNGTYGIVINRPLPGNLMHVCKEPSMTVDASLKRTFRNTTVAYGGPMMPNEYTILHSFGEVTGSHKICHGVYMGGSHELMNQVRDGKLKDTNAMFVKGHIMWQQGELQNELTTGYWYLAAVSSDMILRYAGVELTDKDDPNNLWLDIMTCMGGHFENVSRRFRGKGSDKGRLMP